MYVCWRTCVLQRRVAYLGRASSAFFLSPHNRARGGSSPPAPKSAPAVSSPQVSLGSSNFLDNPGGREGLDCAEGVGGRDFRPTRWLAKFLGLSDRPFAKDWIEAPPAAMRGAFFGVLGSGGWRYRQPTGKALPRDRARNRERCRTSPTCAAGQIERAPNCEPRGSCCRPIL